MVYSFLYGWIFVKNRYENCVVRLFMSAENGLSLWAAENHPAKSACSLASLRALLLMVGSLPSRALVQMFSTGDTLSSTTSMFDSRLTGHLF